MSRTVLVISGSRIARYMTISGDPAKHGLVPVPPGRIGYKGNTPLMTFSGSSLGTGKTHNESEISNGCSPGKKTPTLPLTPHALSSKNMTETCWDLSILDQQSRYTPQFISDGQRVPGVKLPKYLPRNAQFVTMVEWPLRPGDTRVEAYFVGSNCADRHWFLIECTVDDLSPYTTKYLSRRTIALVKKDQLIVEDAAILLLHCAWQFEKMEWNTPAFFMVSNSGIIDDRTVKKIADCVWSKTDGG